MSAKILAKTSDAALTEFWINDDVIRVGSAPDCDLPLAGVAPHALTVQHRGRGYFVFNRSQEAIRIAGQLVLPGASHPWEPGQELEIGSEAALMLQSAEEALRNAPPSVRYDDDDEFSAEQSREPEEKKSRMVTFLVVGAVVVISFMTLGSSNGTGKSTTAQFEEVMKEYTWAHSTNDPTARRILDGVQRARIAELREDYKSAKAKYGEAKDLLWTKKQSAGGALSAVDQQMLDFITERLPRLQ